MIESRCNLTLTSRLGLGCATFGREVDEATSFRVLDHAFDRGFRLFDTAEGYGGGQARAARRQATGVDDVRETSGELHSSELILGRWLRSRGCRKQVVVQTKVLPPLDARRVGDSIDASLNRLNADYIDMFLFHAFDSLTPLAQSFGALQQAVQRGKLLKIGVSNFSAEQLKQSLALAQAFGLRVECLQSNYNLAVREIERELMPLCQENHVPVQSYSPLGAGFLTGKYAADPARLPVGSRFHVLPAHARIYFDDQKFELVERLKTLSGRTGISMAKLAISWVLSRREIDRVLIGARKIEQIDQAIEATQIRFEPEWNQELFSRGDLRDVVKETQNA